MNYGVSKKQIHSDITCQMDVLNGISISSIIYRVEEGMGHNVSAELSAN